MNKQKTEKRPRKKKDNMKSKSRRMKKEVMINTIIKVFKSSPKEPFNYRQISKMIGISNQIQKIQVVEILDTLAAANIITEIDKGRYRYNNWGTVMNGTFVYRQNGKNSFIPEDGGEPILITERNSGHALDGDKVKIQLHTKRKKGGELEGEVIEILENNQRTIVGKLQVTKGFAFLVTEDKTLSNDIFIPIEKLKEGKTGDKAIVRIIEWPQEAKNPIGELIDILGTAGDNEAEMNAILAEFDLPYKYPENVEKAANKISEIITNEEIALRKDFSWCTHCRCDSLCQTRKFD